MKYFNNPKSLEELKKEYRKLAFRYHPDMGGNNEAMQTINSEYGELLSMLSEKYLRGNSFGNCKNNSFDEWRKCKTIKEFRKVQRKSGYKTGWIYFAAIALDLINGIADLEEIRETIGYEPGWVYYKAKELGLI